MSSGPAPRFDGMGRIDGRAERPYIMVDRELVELLDPDELALYVVFLSYLRSPERMTDRECWPTHEELARVYGRGTDAVQRVTKKLIARGLVMSIRRGKTQSNRYRLATALPSDAAETRHHCDAAETRPRDAAETRPRDAAETRYEVEELEVEELKEKNSLSGPADLIEPAAMVLTSEREREEIGIEGGSEDQDEPLAGAIISQAPTHIGKLIQAADVIAAGREEELKTFVEEQNRGAKSPAWWRHIIGNGDVVSYVEQLDAELAAAAARRALLQGFFEPEAAADDAPPPARRRCHVPQHTAELTPSGLCTSCAADAKGGLDADLDQRPPARTTLKPEMPGPRPAPLTDDERAERTERRARIDAETAAWRRLADQAHAGLAAEGIADPSRNQLDQRIAAMQEATP
jgi:hypothetical protein